MNAEIAEMAPKRRDKLHIIAQILEIAKDSTLKTQIMYKANLSFAQLNEYIHFMLSIGLLTKLMENRRETYKTTEKGLNFLQRHTEITELLRTEKRDTGKSIRTPPEALLRKK